MSKRQSHHLQLLLLLLFLEDSLGLFEELYTIETFDKVAELKISAAENQFF